MRPNSCTPATHTTETTDDGYLELLARLNQQAARILCAPPRRAAALTYLRQRGIDTTALPAAWPLGYAPPGWSRLLDQLRADYPEQTLLDAGLARPTSRGGLIDAFRDRVIFPIHDTAGRVAGFLGRDTSDDPRAPKYLNTPRTALYDKSSLLYGPAETELTNPHAHQPVLVEGPLDVLAITTRAHATGETDLLPAAACGTAFTPTHARRVAELAYEHHSPVVIALDADPAGRTAALAAGEHLRALGLDTRIAQLPAGSDPAEHLTHPDNTLATYRADNALPLFTAQVEHAIAAQGERIQWIEGRLTAARTITTTLASYPVSYAAAQIGWLANTLDLDPTTITAELAHAYRSPRTAAGRRHELAAIDSRTQRAARLNYLSL